MLVYCTQNNSFHSLTNSDNIIIISISDRGVHPPTAMTQPFSFLFSPFTSPFNGGPGDNPRKFVGVKDARMWVLEHFGHLYEPGCLTVSCNFRISSKCVCSIVQSPVPVKMCVSSDRNAPFPLCYHSMPALQALRSWLTGRCITLYQGRNHGWKVEGGTKVWVPTLGCLRHALGQRAGCWVREGVAPSRCEDQGVSPHKMFENSDVKSCILMTTCCEISCFLKTTAKKLGDQYIVAPT